MNSMMRLLVLEVVANKKFLENLNSILQRDRQKIVPEGGEDSESSGTFDLEAEFNALLLTENQRISDSKITNNFLSLSQELSACEAKI